MTSRPEMLGPFAGVCLSVVVACLLVGCGPEPTAGAHISYYLQPGQSLADISRVVLVEIDDDKRSPRDSRRITQALARAMQDRRLFHVRVVYRDDALCDGLALDRPEGLTVADMQLIRRRFQCDAVCFGHLSDYQTYPQMRLGLFLNLVDLRRGELVWGVDHIWAAADKALEQRLKRFFMDQQRSGFGPAGWELALMSPRTFERFVAFEAAATLDASTANKPLTPAEQAVIDTVDAMHD